MTTVEIDLSQDKPARLIARAKRLTILFAVVQAFLFLVSTKAAADMISFVMLLAGAGLTMELPVVKEMMATPEGQERFMAYLINNAGEIRAHWNIEWPLFLIVFSGVAVLGVIKKLRTRKPRSGTPLSEYQPGVTVPENLAGRELVLSNRSAISRKKIYIGIDSARFIKTNLVYFFFFLQHEWFHHKSGDTTWVPFARFLSDVSAVFLAVYFGAIVIPFIVPLGPLHAWPVVSGLAMVLLALVGFSVMHRLFKYDTGRFIYFKEQLADGFAAAKTPITPSELFAGDGVVGSASLFEEGPAAYQRRIFIESERADQPVALLSAMLVKWALIRTVAMIVATWAPVTIAAILVIDLLLAACVIPFIRTAWRLGTSDPPPSTWIAATLPLVVFFVMAPLWLGFILTNLPAGTSGTADWTWVHFVIALPTAPAVLAFVFVAGMVIRRVTRAIR
ncbi:hypothetical protein N825_10990 [Skermanella stibiiresistens SB22]|uniref:Uncharacterized protein n=1 Tax=Skermanella stibiiresistens SB22 TaxID=1385369 RepID=W9H4W8_9PROT|nr:hypothetical protein [Skermanella stibiiresistens]EWY38803.1 hypothetical protein N825_10990 [Skermanella stibiiresistens SB22]